jgi:hypothetical protein
MAEVSTISGEDHLAFSLLEGHPCWSKCGRRTRPFLGRAFREHRTNVGVLPIPLIVRGLRARRGHLAAPILFPNSLITSLEMEAD